MSAELELEQIIMSHFHAGATAGSSWRLNPSAAASDILAAGYSKLRTITTEEEVEALPQGTKLYSPGTTHSWVLNDLSHASGGVRVHGTGGGYTYIHDFIRQQAPLHILYTPKES